jgi:hypothetical protein
MVGEGEGGQESEVEMMGFDAVFRPSTSVAARPSVWHRGRSTMHVIPEGGDSAGVNPLFVERSEAGGQDPDRDPDLDFDSVFTTPTERPVARAASRFLRMSVAGEKPGGGVTSEQGLNPLFVGRRATKGGSRRGWELGEGGEGH